MPLPELVLAKGKESKISMTVGKGEVTVNSINLGNSDLNLNLTGSIKMRQKLEYSVLNLDGTFQPSQALTQAVPIFFIVENQKTPEGKYPLSIRGRLSKVKVSVGDKQLPF
jgi:type II secretion system protein N